MTGAASLPTYEGNGGLHAQQRTQVTAGSVLGETLTEEKNTDKALSALAEAALNRQAQEAAE
jgi:ferritin-like metal-binding protein YciE